MVLAESFEMQDSLKSSRLRKRESELTLEARGRLCFIPGEGHEVHGSASKVCLVGFALLMIKRQ